MRKTGKNEERKEEGWKGEREGKRKEGKENRRTFILKL